MPSPADLAIALSRRIDTSADRVRGLDEVFGGSLGGSRLLAARKLDADLGDLLRVGANWARFAIGATAERLALSGFATNGTERPDLFSLWRASMPASSEALLWLDVLRHGRAYLTSWTDDTGAPRLTAGSARNTVHEIEPITGSVTRVATRWIDPANGRPRLTIYSDADVVRLAASGGVALDPDGAAPTAMAVSSWQTVEVVPNPLGRCPVSPIVLRASMTDTVGESDLTPLQGIQSAIDKVLCDLLVISEALAAPRRWATGVEVPLDPETGQPVDPFAGAGPGRFLVVEDPAAKLGQLPAADLAGPLALLERLTEDLLSRASVPRHLAIGGARGQQVNAESIEAAEAGLLARVAHRQAALGDGVARAVRLLAEVATGRPEPFVVPKWHQAKTTTTAGQVDALVKLLSAGVPGALAGRLVNLSPSDAAQLTTAPPAAPTLVIPS